MDRAENVTGSKNDVVETKVAVLQAFLNDVIRKEMPNCAYVYDPELSYESGLKTLRNNNKMNQAYQDPAELFIFRTTPLRHPDDGQAPNARSTHQNGVIKDPDGTATIYSAVHAEFDLEFLYCNPIMEEAQRFEVVFLSDDGISGTPEVDVKLGDLGYFKHYLKWEKLLDVTVNTADNYFKAYASSMRIRGYFFVFRGEGKVIKEIKNQVKTFTSDLPGAIHLETVINK